MITAIIIKLYNADISC